MMSGKDNLIYTNFFSNKDYVIKLLPNRLHYISLAKNLPKDVWNNFRRVHIEDKNGTCELCGLKMKSYHNCHEIFEVDNDTIKLIGIKVLCYNCHMTQHVGFVSLGKSNISMNELKKHYEKISGKDFNKEIADAIKEYDVKTKELKDRRFKFKISDDLLGKEIIKDYEKHIESLIN